MHRQYTPPMGTIYSEEWAADVLAEYETRTPRSLAVEVLDLRRELSDAELVDPLAQEVVGYLVGPRLQLARFEVQCRVRDGRA